MKSPAKNKEICCISFYEELQNEESVNSLFESLKSNIKRDWFSKHAYKCMPLVIGNQYGFILKSLFDFDVSWNGGNCPSSLVVSSDDPEWNSNISQSISSHFGLGILTVSTPFTLRTAKNTNLITINPPNMFKDGVQHMMGVIESDNLRRNFTFNLKITRVNHAIRFKKGEPIGCFMPYPRGFIDQFYINDASNSLSQKRIKSERDCMEEYTKIREQSCPIKGDSLYRKGFDAMGNKFENHQIKLN